MIILFDKNEISKEEPFTTLGIGILKDAISCEVTEELNGAFELEMEYPISGKLYSELQNERIIVVPPNDIDEPQAFIIYKITKPINGEVTVYAEHISYNMSKVPVRAIHAEDLDDVCQKVNTRQLINSKFRLTRYDNPLDPTGTKNNVMTEFTTKVPYSMRSLLAGQEGSILDVYGGEFVFDNFNVILKNRRGKNRDFYIRYSKNMLDLEQEESSEKAFNGVCPYYDSTTTETKVANSGRYKEIYLSSEETQTYTDPETGEDLHPKEWLSYSDSGGFIDKVVSLSVTNIIATQGELYNHLVRAKYVQPTEEGSEHKNYFIDVTYNMAYIDPKCNDEYGKRWLAKDEMLEQYYTPEADNNSMAWNPYNLPIGDQPGQWNPLKHYDLIFRIFSQGDKMYHCYLWKETSVGSGEFRYIEATDEDGVSAYLPSLPSVSTVTEEHENILVYEGDIIYINEVRAVPDENATEFGENWLKRVEELEQLTSLDPRWDIKDTIVPVEHVIYKVATLETYINGYPIEGKTLYARDWLSATEGGSVPLEPIDGKGYLVLREDGVTFYYRWDELSEKYVQMNDTRYTYANYEWNDNLHRYVTHQTSGDKILTLDLTDKFDDTQKEGSRFQKKLYDQTVKYVRDNKIGQYTTNIKVSFIKLSSSPEYASWKNLEKVYLGDSVHVEYIELGISSTKKVVKTEYNVLTETYNSIELGEKSSTFTGVALIEGDDISSLTNDKNYADVVTVTSLVAQRITADYIKSMSADITEATIKTLTADSITAVVVEAQRFEIDQLVAQLLVADDALIRKQLTVGENLIVNGEINVKGGSIRISGKEYLNTVKAYINQYSEEDYEFDYLVLNKNDTEPLNPLKYPDGTIFEVYNNIDVFQEYLVYEYASGGSEGGYVPQHFDEDTMFEVDQYGNVIANSLDITGGAITITAKTVRAYIDSTQTEYSSKWLKKMNYHGQYETIVPDIYTDYEVTTTVNDQETTVCYHWKKITDTITAYLNPDPDAAYHESEWLVLNKTDTTPLDPTDYPADTIFEVYRQNGTFREYASFNTTTDLYSTVSEANVLKYVEEDPFNTLFEVDKAGNVVANSLEITGGEINLSNGTFRVDRNGRCTASSINISGFIYDPVTGENISNVSFETTDASIDSLTSDNIHVDDLYINNIVLSYDNYSSRESTTIKIDCTAENFKYYDDGFECDLIFGVITDTRWNDTYQGSIFLKNIEVSFRKLNPTSMSDYVTTYIPNITINIANKTTKIHRIMQRDQDNVTEPFFFADWRCDGKVYGGNLYANCTRAVPGTTSHNVLVIQNKSIFEEYTEAYADPNEVPLTLDWLYYDSNLTELVQPTRNSKYMVHFNTTTIKYVIYEGGSYQYIANPPESYDFYGDLICRDIGNKDEYIQNGYFTNLFVEEYLTISDGKYGNVPDRGSTYQIYPMVYVGGSQFTSQTLIPRVIYEIPLYLIPSGSTFVVSGKVTLLARTDANTPSVNLYSLDLNDDAEIISIQLTICNGDGDASDTPHFNYDDRDYNWYAGWKGDQLYLYSLLEQDFDFYYTVICKKN